MRKKINALAVLLISVGILLSGCNTGSQQVTLTYKFTPDKIYHYKYDSRISSSLHENGSLVYRGDKSHLIFYTQETISIIDSTKAKQRFTYTLKNTTDNNPGPDTWSNEFVMSSNGRVVGIEIENDSSRQSLDYFRTLMEQAAPVYPDQAVSPGYSWNNTVKVLLEEGSTDASTTYTLKALVREAGYDCAVIEYTGTMIIPLVKGMGDDPSATVSGSDKIDVQGVTYFAYAEGIIIKEKETSHLLRRGKVLKDGRSIEFSVEETRSSNTILMQIE